MANVIKFRGITKLDLPVADMLNEIALEKPENAFVICWSETENSATFHSSSPHTQRVIHELNRFMHKYYNGDFGL